MTLLHSYSALFLLLLWPTLGDSYSHDTKPTSGSSRRIFLSHAASISAAVVTCPFLAPAPQAARAGLLDEFGTDPTKIVQAPPPPLVTPTGTLKKAESSIEPNLRSNYYYPTNKKRYLPRIQKCSSEIQIAADRIGAQDWESVTIFATKTADDTILPLKLYSSSLTGGGTNVKVAYITTLNTAAAVFETNQKLLVKAVNKRDVQGSSEALQHMSEALSTYRSAAGLKDDIDDLPSVDEIRRASSRYLGKSYEKGALVRND